MRMPCLQVHAYEANVHRVVLPRAGRKAMLLPMISETEFCEHIEDDDFSIRYGNLVCIHTNDGQLFVCMTYKLYERLLERKEQVTSL